MTVELYDPNISYAAPSGAHLTYRGGPLLKAARLFGVFIDAGSGYPLVDQMRSFMKWLITSDVVSGMAEYNVGTGVYVGDAVIKLGGSTPPPPPKDCSAELQALIDCIQAGGSIGGGKKKKHASLDLPHRKKLRMASTAVTDAQIQKLIRDNIKSGVLPSPDSETLFVTFWPSGIVIQYDPQDASCQQFCGYHSNDGKNYYAVLPYPDCAGCTGGMSVLDALTSVTTHEICEAVTDPVPGSGWYDDQNGEIGDICAWQTRVDAGWTVQEEWSNEKNACI